MCICALTAIRTESDLKGQCKAVMQSISLPAIKTRIKHRKYCYNNTKRQIILFTNRSIKDIELLYY